MSDVLITEVDEPQYGVLDTGFSRMRMPEIRAAIVEDLQFRTNLIFETRPDSITGQFIDTFAEREAILWELAESVYHAMYPISSFGTNLDHSVAFAGVRRAFERRTAAWVICYGVEGTTIPRGALIRQSITRDLYASTDPLTITQQALIDVHVSIDSGIEGQQYSIRIDGTLYAYTAAPGDDFLTIAAKLAQLLILSRKEVLTDANHIRIWALELVPFSIEVGTDITILQIGSGVNFLAQEFGDLPCPIGSLTQIVSSRNGWQAVNNIVPGLIGRELETDDELRLRYDIGVFRLGAATVESIYANISQNIPGLLALVVLENKEDHVSPEGLLPHSIEVIAHGGDAQLIAYQIFLVKGAGIDVNGSIVVNVRDSQGYDHDIKFNRPTIITVWVRIQVWLNEEEVLPPDAVIRIQNATVEYGNTIGIKNDVIVQRFFGPIYRTCPGIGRMVITMAAGITEPPNQAFLEDNINILPRELSRFDTSRVIVNINFPPNP